MPLLRSRLLLASLSSQRRRIARPTSARVVERGSLLHRPSWSKLYAQRGNRTLSTDTEGQTKKDGGLLLSDGCVQVCSAMPVISPLSFLCPS